jgi:two-component system alkaline phosphatase synthesis response regulator PhoP
LSQKRFNSKKKFGRINMTKGKILIVDDDKDYSESLMLMLESYGYNVEQAYNIREGKASIINEKPLLIILDVMMEKMTDGFDLCRELKANPSLSSIPILMLTAITDKTGIKYSLEEDSEYLPADDYISKPISFSDLISKAERLIKAAALNVKE